MIDQTPNQPRQDETLAAEQLQPLESPVQSEEEMLRLYQEQIRRMSCPGCGEDEEIF